MKYRKIYNYLNSTDPELQTLAINLLYNTPKVKEYVSGIFGYKFEYILNYYFNIIFMNNDEYIRQAYIGIVRGILLEMNEKVPKNRSIIQILCYRYNSYYKYDCETYHFIGIYKMMILCDLLRYSKFYRKHFNRQICILSRSNKFISLKEILSNIHYQILHHQADSIFVDKCLSILMQFNNGHTKRNNR